VCRAAGQLNLTGSERGATESDYQERIRRILRHYTNYWKHIFDGAPANTGSERVTAYEMRGLMGLGKRLLRF